MIERIKVNIIEDDHTLFEDEDIALGSMVNIFKEHIITDRKKVLDGLFKRSVLLGFAS